MSMDNLKVYEVDPEELEATVTKVESTSQAVGMQQGADKCGVAHLRKGRVVARGGNSHLAPQDQGGARE